MAGKMPSSSSPFVKSFKCKHCGAAVTIRNTRDSIVVICQSCQSTIDLTDPNYRILATAAQKINYRPLIPLGTRGTLHEIEWEVLGYLLRKDQASEYTWDELLLFNPYHGYRWLTQAEGHWNYVTMIKERPSIQSGLLGTSTRAPARYRGKRYQVFHRGQAEIKAVLGEFYWRAKVGDTVAVEDYICPPEMLSLEKDDSEQNWSVGEYIEPQIIQNAFQLESLVPKVGVAPNQPCSHAAHSKTIWLLWGLFVFIAIALQLNHLLTSPGEVVFQETYPYTHDQKKTIVTTPFALKHGLSNVSFQLTAPVQNTWLAIDGDLVNEATGESYPVAETVEAYSGYDGGEAWSEGGNEKQERLPAIPDGVYHLEFEAMAAGMNDISRYVQVAPDMVYTLTVLRKVPTWSNFLWMLLFLSLMPIWVWWRHGTFETARWSNSDFYQSSSDDE